MRNERGFTLLEVLIASVIAAAVFGVLLRSAMSGISTARDAGAYETAVALARSHLALLGRDMASLPADQHGSDGPFEWRVRLTREAVADPGAGIVNWYLHKDEPRAALYAVSVSIAWQSEGRRHELDIETQRLGFAPPPPPDTQ